MRVFIIISFIISITQTSYSQSNSLDAKGLYKMAEDQYSSASHHFDREKHSEDNENKEESLDYTNFVTEHKADSCLTKVISIVGRNPKTLYLLIKLHYLQQQEKKWLASKEDYNGILKDVEEFFSKIDKSSYPPEKYEEILSLKKETELKLELPQIKNQIAFTSKEQAINYIVATLSDVNNYNPTTTTNTSPVSAHEVNYISAKWDGNNIITLFGYELQIRNPKLCRYFGAVIDVSELQKSSAIRYDGKEYNEFQYLFVSHGYYFPKNLSVSKLVAAGMDDNYNYPKYKKEIQSLTDILSKMDKKIIEVKKNPFTIFLQLLPDPSYPEQRVDFNNNFVDFQIRYENNPPFFTYTYFRENAEVNYLNAWDYLYNVFNNKH